MNVPAFQDWLFRSVVVGGAAAACVMLCPAGWRVRVRQVVPVTAFGVLIALAAGLVRPLPSFEMRAPEIVTRWTAAAGAWMAPWLMWAFAAVALVFLARTAAGASAVSRLVRHSRPVRGHAWRSSLDECQRTLGLRGRVRVLLAGSGFVPSATGLFRRTVLLPDEALRWTREQRRLVLMHELGHFRRGDLWTHALGEIACAIHWFNPFVWMLHRHLALEREFACDALVIARGAERQDYAALLWKMGVEASRPRLASVAYLAMAAPGRGKLEQRVLRILAPVRDAGLCLRVADSALCLGGAALLVLCASFKPSLAVAARWTPQEINARLSADPFPGER